MRPRHAVLPTPSVSLRSVPLPHYLPKSFPCHTSENSPVSPAIATDPKTHLSKSCICHTSDIPPGGDIGLSDARTSTSASVPTVPPAINYPLYFQTLAHSFALTKTSTLLFSIASALFAKNHPGWGEGVDYPSSL